jgi:hypothetical protein
MDMDNEALRKELLRAQMEVLVWKKKAQQYHKRLLLLGAQDDPEDTAPDPYKVLYDYYCSLGLVKHRALTTEMKNAIDIARRRGGYTWKEMATLLYRHSMIVKLSSGDGEYAVRPRGIAEFFGQKVAGGTCLICSEYADDGAKWLRYQAIWKEYLDKSKL